MLHHFMLCMATKAFSIITVTEEVMFLPVSSGYLVVWCVKFFSRI